MIQTMSRSKVSRLPLGAMPTADAHAYADACYLALQTRDARFDGRFFTAVTSTGIYCRPVCKVRCPKRENCRFYALAAQAEQAGFRPCLRCRPELAPRATHNPHAKAAPWATDTVLGALSAPNTQPAWSVQDASSILAQQAARLLDAPERWSEGTTSMAALAARMGLSERHVRRIFEAYWGVSPLQYWQTSRLLSAKQLLTDTALPVAHVALLSGFGSVRRFNAAFVGHYHLQPSALRKGARTAANPQGAAALADALMLRAAYRPPYDVGAMLQFFAARALVGVEWVDLAKRCITRTVRFAAPQDGLGPTGTQPELQGWVQAQFDAAACTVQLRISASLSPVLPTVLAQMRSWLDLDADPQAINAVLLPDFAGAEGLRVPGTMDGFELAVRAILGQQITVAAARTLGARLVERCGEPLAANPEAWGLNRLFPSAAALAAVSPDALGQLGIVKQRQKAIQAIAQAVVQGQLSLHPGADVPSTLETLQALPGIGPWTAQYIALRALRWPDAFPAGDVALHKALGVQGTAQAQRSAEAASQRWRPWRSYAVVRAWARLNPDP